MRCDMFFEKKPYPERSYPIEQIPSTVPNEYQSAQIERKFGMFIHFGINTFNNTEWSNGKLPVDSYRPSAIDAEQWIGTAYEAGMNYVVLITKHHDGFCLWDTDTTEYSVNYSPVKTDVVKAVSEVCKKYGVKLGLYYSLWDRHEKCYSDDEKYVEYMLRQLSELTDGRYGEVVELWLDGGWEKACRQWGLDRIYNLVKTNQPQCQIGVNITIGKYKETKAAADKTYLPEKYRYGDPISMFPSDFRLWDPHMCRADDPKVYTFNGKEYYMPFEYTICSRSSGNWFYSDTYERKPLMDVDKVAENCKTLFDAQNLAVINLPPNKDGRLVGGDIENLMKLSEKLGIRREVKK